MITGQKYGPPSLMKQCVVPVYGITILQSPWHWMAPIDLCSFWQYVAVPWLTVAPVESLQTQCTLVRRPGALHATGKGARGFDQFPLVMEYECSVLPFGPPTLNGLPDIL